MVECKFAVNVDVLYFVRSIMLMCSITPDYCKYIILGFGVVLNRSRKRVFVPLFMIYA